MPRNPGWRAGFLCFCPATVPRESVTFYPFRRWALFLRRFAAGNVSAPGTPNLSLRTDSGARFASKKTLILRQNLENTGPEFFLPPRSMVLKVVRGKILETLELPRRRPFCNPFIDRLSKIKVISEITFTVICYRERRNEIKRKAVGRTRPVPIWESRA